MVALRDPADDPETLGICRLLLFMIFCHEKVNWEPVCPMQWSKITFVQFKIIKGVE